MTNYTRKFREKSIRDDFSLQKLVNRTLDMFVYDEEFQKKVLEYDNLEKVVQINNKKRFWENGITKIKKGYRK